jgi:hypothetical protein
VLLLEQLLQSGWVVVSKPKKHASQKSKDWGLCNPLLASVLSAEDSKLLGEG